MGYVGAVHFTAFSEISELSVISFDIVYEDGGFFGS